MPSKTYDPQPTSVGGMYSVQKSRSLGGVTAQVALDSSPSSSPVPQEQGRRTPNLNSLRRKFGKKKAQSVEEEADYVDGSSLKKKNKHKVGNIFKWFKKDKEDIQENVELSPKLARVVQKPSERPQRILVGAPLKHRSSSYDSLCSVGSATSSFAFVPVAHYQVGRAVESKKRIAIGLNCGVDTYRARREVANNGAEHVDLGTKYNLVASESPPTLRRGNENLSAVAGPSLPAGPLLPFGRALSTESDSDTTIEMESVSQRGSPEPRKAFVEGENGLIKPRELTGQLLHPITIKLTPEEAKNALKEIGLDSDSCGTLRYFPARSELPAGRGSAGKPESLPNIWGGEGRERAQDRAQSNNPFGDTASLAATLPLKRRSTAASSARNSINSDEGRGSHCPGKRRAPPPPPGSSRPTSPSASEGARPRNNNPFLVGRQRKGPAPRPPGMLERSENGGPGTEGLASGQPENGQHGQLPVSSPSSPVPHEWVLQDGVLRSLRDSRADLIPSPTPVEEIKEVAKVPLSPKPWYKRAITKDGQKAKNKDDRGKKAKSPENLPEIHTSRDTIKMKDPIEEKYSQFVKVSRENLVETPRSPKQFLRSKIMPSSPKAERPSSRPISGLMGISDLDRQAAEIIRKKNEDESAKKKANDQRFYTNATSEEDSTQRALDIIMENVSVRMQNMDNKDCRQLDDNRLDDRLKDLAVSEAQNSDLSEKVKVSGGKGLQTANEVQPQKQQPATAGSAQAGSLAPTSNASHSQLSSGKSLSSQEIPVANESEAIRTSTTATMDNVVSDLNSFLASTRKAMSSPAAQKRLAMVQVAKEQAKGSSTNAKEQPVPGVGTKSGKAQQKLVGESRGTMGLSVGAESGIGKLITNGNSSPSTVSVADQQPLERKSCLPPPPTPAPLPPLAVEKADGWSCPRCTLINYSAQLWCEACGGRRAGPALQTQFKEVEEEKEEEGKEAPPKPGNVLNKLFMFSDMEAKAKETPSLIRRRSADVNKLTRTYSTAAMLPIDENPLAGTLTRISAQQAQLATSKPLELQTGQQSNKAGGITSQVEEKTCNPEQMKSTDPGAQRGQTDIIKEQERLLEQAKANMIQKKKGTGNGDPGDDSTLPSRCILSGPEKVKSELNELQAAPRLPESGLTRVQATRPTPGASLQEDVQQLSPASSNGQNQSRDKPYSIKKDETQKSTVPSNPIQPPKFELKDLRKVETKTEVSVEGKCSPGVKRSSSFKGSFDFTKTPSAFLTSKSNIPRFAASVSEGFKQEGDRGQTGGLQKSREVAQQSSDSRDKNGETREKKCDTQSPTCESSASKFPLSRTDITPEERQTDSVTSVGRGIEKNIIIPASCPPQRRSLIQENVNEEVIIEGIMKGHIKDKLELEGQDSSDKNIDAKQRIASKVLKESGFQQELPNGESKSEQNRNNDLKGRTKVTSGADSSGKAHRQEEVIQEEQKVQERKREEERMIKKKREEKRKIDQRIEEEKRKERILVEREEERRRETEIQQRQEEERREKLKEEEAELREIERKQLEMRKQEAKNVEERKRSMEKKRREEDALREKRIVAIAEQKRAEEEEARTRVERRKDAVPRLQFLGSEVIKSQPGRDDHRLSSGLDLNSRAAESKPHSMPIKNRKSIEDREAPKVPPKKEPYYAQPTSPPRPVTPPRPRSPLHSRPLSALSHGSGSPPPRPAPPLLRGGQAPSRQQARLSSAYDWDPFRARSTTPQATKLELSRQASFASQPSGSYSQRRYSSDSPEPDDPRWRSEVERALSQIRTTSLDTEDYSAITPLVTRKQSVSSVHSTPLLQPKLSKDFGFVSSNKKEPMPKPPRRNRSKDLMQSVGPGSAPSSKDTTPINSPVRPVRGARGRSSRQSTRPASQMEENIYECVTPGPLPYTPLQVRSQAFSSSSDSESDFRTPHASPRFVRHNPKPKTKSSNKVQSSASKASLASSRASVNSSKSNSKSKTSSSRVKPSSSVILRDRGQSYENTRGFPGGLTEQQKHLSSTSLASTSSSGERGPRPKLIPPRTCQEPIPTPRTRSLARRSREPSQETTGVSPRGTRARREPYYKVPPPNPREVTPPLPASSHHYEYLDLEGGQGGLQEVVPPTPASGRRSSASSINKKNSLKKKSSAEVNTSAVAVTLDEYGDKFYDTKEDVGDVLIKKSKGIATLPDGSTYPCVIVQKKTKKGSLEKASSGSDKNHTSHRSTDSLPSSSSSRGSVSTGPTLKKTSSRKNSQQETPSSANSLRAYSPVVASSPAPKQYREYSPAAPLPSKGTATKPAIQNDWLDALKPKVVEERVPKPKDILDGVLYTSRALQEETQIYEKGLAKFSLIEPEVFQMYDVCQQREKSPKLERLESDSTSGDELQVFLFMLLN